VTVAASNSNTLAEVLNVSYTSTANKWIMDSGCSFHMCPNIDWFQNFSTKETGTIFMGNNHSCSIKGICDIFMKLHDIRLEC